MKKVRIVLPILIVAIVAMAIVYIDAPENTVMVRDVVATPDCFYQRMPVGDTMPVIPFDSPQQEAGECPSYLFTVQWNVYIRPFATDWDDDVPLGLRYRVCPSLYCSGIGTAYAHCENPVDHNYKCTDELLYGETVIYRDAIPELGWFDKGYFLQMNYWGWYPLCVTLPGREEICYTDWTPTQTISQAVEDWKSAR